MSRLPPRAVLLWVIVAGLGSNAAAEERILHTFKKLRITNAYHAEGASFGDFNRDGTNDMVCGPYWYEAPTFKKRHEIYPPKTFPAARGYSDNFFSFVHDLNGDTWADVLVVGLPGTPAHWYENPKGKDGHWKKRLAARDVGNESPMFLDLTGDKKPELVCNSGGLLGYFEPRWDSLRRGGGSDLDQPWLFTAVIAEGKYHRFTHGLGVGDVNGDGRKDLLMGNGWWEHPKDFGKSPYWKHHPFRFGRGPAQMYVYDVDGDGDGDVITCDYAHGWGLSWFERLASSDGKVSFKEHRFMGSTPEDNAYGVKFSQPHAISLVDIDGDGLKDILTGKCRWAHGPKGDPEPNAAPVIYWFRLTRTKAGVEWVPHLVDDASGVGRQVEAGDLNGDGRLDIVAANKVGVFVFLHEARKVSDEEWEAARPKKTKKAETAKKAKKAK